jgi:hypothetical protein
MPHTTLKLHPGVDQNRTLALNEAAISTTQLVRFVPDKQGLGLVQKLGGWQKFPNSTASNSGPTTRALWAWQDTNAVSHLAVGNQSTLSYAGTATVSGSSVTLPASFTGGSPASSVNNFYVGWFITIGSTSYKITAYNGSTRVATVNVAPPAGSQSFTLVNPTLIVITNGQKSSISPQGRTSSVAPQFSTTVGSDVVQIYDANSNITDYDYVFIETQISVGGLFLFGLYRCSFVDPDRYTIQATNLDGTPQYATANVVNGGVTPKFTFSPGQQYSDVYIPNNPYVVGDVFPVLVPTTIGDTTLYGNYTVSETNPPAVDTFRIFLPNGANSVATTSTSGTGATAIIGFSATYKFLAGNTVIAANIDPAGYNGVYAITAATSNTVAYLNATTGSMVSAGILFAVDGYLNDGNAYFQYYITPGPPTFGVGYGLGGYGAGGYGIGGSSPITPGGTPITATDWTLDNWGSILIACPVGGAIYSWSTDTVNGAATIINNSPIANDGIFVAMPQRQIVAWGSTFTGILDPLLIRWCDVNNYEEWTASLTNQAGSYRLPKGSKVVGCIQGPQQGLVWTDLGIWAMQYVGPPYVYQFNEIGTGCGLISRKAAASMNGTVYWMSQSQFYRLGGSGVEPIRCPVWDVIFQDLDTTNLNKIRIAPNSAFGEITWYYPTMSNGGEVSHYVKYNVVLDQWDFGALVRTSWINQSVFGPPIGSDGTYIYQHETSKNADGSAMISSFQTGYFVLSEGEWKVFVDQIWPDMKWGYYDGTQNASVQITFYVADYPGDAVSAPSGGIRTYGPFTMTDATTFITPRFRGRLMSIKIQSSDLNSFWRIGAMRYRFQQDGKF